MDNDDLIKKLDSMGYFGELDEAFVQRVKNGVNNVLASAGSNRAAGRLEIGQMVVGLEKKYKKWLGANGIKKPTKRDFGRFLGVLQTEYGVKFGENGVPAPEAQPAASKPSALNPNGSPQQGTAPQTQQGAAQPQSSNNQTQQPAAAPASGAAQPAAATAPTPSQAAALPKDLINSVTHLGRLAQRNDGDENDTREHLSKLLTTASKRKLTPTLSAQLKEIVAKHPSSNVAQWINDALQQVQESVQVVLEADQNPDEPFSMEQAREYFQRIARYSFNNSNGAAAAAGGTSTDGTQGAQGAPKDQGKSDENGGLKTNGTMQMVAMDINKLRMQLRRINFQDDNIEELKKFVHDTSNDDILGVARQLQNSNVFHSPQQAYACLVVYLRALSSGARS